MAETQINKEQIRQNELIIESENVHQLVALTQDAYDALVTAGTVDSTTLYIIVPEESN